MNWYKVSGQHQHTKRNYVTYFQVTKEGFALLEYHEFLCYENEPVDYLGLQKRKWNSIPEEWEKCEVQNPEVLRLYEEVTE